MTMTARIPRDYTELFGFYGPFIAGEIRKKNTVATNFEDAYQAVCLSLVEAKVIEKFHTRAADDVEYPETMTLAQAIEALGITLEQWRTHQSNYRHRPGFKWMPDPINASKPGKGWMSKKAIFLTSDIHRIDHEAEHQFKTRGPIAAPTVRSEPTPYQFMNYLGRAVRNHFANWCRGRSRKWQDCLGDQTHVKKAGRRGDTTEQPAWTARPTHGSGQEPQFHQADGSFNTFWTDTIRDDSVEGGLEARIELSRVLTKFATRVPEEKHQAEILDLIQNGYSLVEAIKLSSLSSIRKRVLAKVFA